MAGPFYNCIKATVTGTPGTGAATPNAASSGFLAWSTVPTGWVGMVRFEDGTDWELQYCYWNGTTLSRSATKQFVSSSTGSALTLTSAATAALIADGGEIAPHPLVLQMGTTIVPGATTVASSGMATITVTGTGASASLATTNYLTEQKRVQITSATTANAQAGASEGIITHAVTSSTAGRGGWEFGCRFGGSVLVTGQRMFCGMTATTMIAVTTEPSAQTFNMAGLGLDSTDTNFQFLTNSGAGSGTKIDTAIPFVANGWYEVTIWTPPGSTTVSMLLIRLDTGAIYYGSTSTDVPATGSLMLPQCIGGLASTTGTAFVLQFGAMTVRSGAS